MVADAGAALKNPAAGGQTQLPAAGLHPAIEDLFQQAPPGDGGLQEISADENGKPDAIKIDGQGEYRPGQNE